MVHNSEFKTEFLRLIASDLEYLKKKWGPDVDEDSLRRDCILLRRLLVEGELMRAWRQVGLEKQPKILTSRLCITGNEKTLRFAQTGGGLSGREGEGVAIVTNVQYHKNTDIRGYLQKQRRQAEEYPKEALALTVFLDSICIIAEGNEISRRDLILYVANTLGCAHTDISREFRERHRAKFQALDMVVMPKGVGLEVVGRNPVHYELLSIGQALANSKDIDKLRKRIVEVIGRRKG